MTRPRPAALLLVTLSALVPLGCGLLPEESIEGLLLIDSRPTELLDCEVHSNFSTVLMRAEGDQMVRLEASGDVALGSVDCVLAEFISCDLFGCHGPDVDCPESDVRWFTDCGAVTIEPLGYSEPIFDVAAVFNCSDDQRTVVGQFTVEDCQSD